MDKWSEDQIKKMQLGGNRKCMEFFKAHPGIVYSIVIVIDSLLKISLAPILLQFSDWREGMTIQEKYQRYLIFVVNSSNQSHNQKLKINYSPSLLLVNLPSFTRKNYKQNVMVVHGPCLHEPTLPVLLLDHNKYLKMVVEEAEWPLDPIYPPPSTATMAMLDPMEWVEEEGWEEEVEVLVELAPKPTRRETKITFIKRGWRTIPDLIIFRLLKEANMWDSVAQAVKRENERVDEEGG